MQWSTPCLPVTLHVLPSGSRRYPSAQIQTKVPRLLEHSWLQLDGRVHSSISLGYQRNRRFKGHSTRQLHLISFRHILICLHFCELVAKMSLDIPITINIRLVCMGASVGSTKFFSLKLMQTLSWSNYSSFAKILQHLSPLKKNQTG